MADITSANEFVPAPASSNPYASLPGGGPLTAANGNMGALQGALYRAQMPMMDQDSIDEVKDTLFSRVRSPEDLAASKEARRGALTAYQQANLAPDSDWTPDRYIAYGMAKNDKPWDVTNGVANGIALSMEADLAKQGKKYKAGVDNGKLGLDFENKEEGYDDKIEGKSLEDLTSMANAQSRINAIGAKAAAGGGGKNNGILNIPGFGAVNTNIIDPETGAPKLVALSAKGMEMQQNAIKLATKLAESKQNPMNFPSLEARDEWIQKKAAEIFNPQANALVDAQIRAYAQTGNLPPVPEGTLVPGMPGYVPPTPGAAPAPVMKYDQKGRIGPTNAAERRMAAGMDGLPGYGEPSALPPAVPVPPSFVQENNKRIYEIDQALEDPQNGKEAKALLAKEKESLVSQNVAAMKADIVKMSKNPADPVKAAATAPVTPAPATKVPGVTLDTQEAQQGRIKTSEAQATSFIKSNDDLIHRPAAAAAATLSTVEQLRSIPFTPGAFDKQKSTIGNMLEAVGIKGSLVTEAGNINNAAKTIAADVNSRVKAEVGVQTDSDVERQANESAKITDPKASFDFSLNQMEENSKRKIAKAAFVKKIENLPDAARHDVNSEWIEESKKTLGPSITNYNGKAIFRSQFIRQAVAQNPDMDPEQAQAEAAKAWMQVSKPKKASK